MLVENKRVIAEYEDWKVFEVWQSVAPSLKELELCYVSICPGSRDPTLQFKEFRIIDFYSKKPLVYQRAVNLCFESDDCPQVIKDTILVYLL